MSDRLIQQLDVSYDASELLAKVERRRRMLRSRLISLGITIVVMLGIYLWRRHEQQEVGYIAVYAVVLGLSLAWLAVTLVAFLRARSDLAAVGSGVALRIGPPGIELATLFVPWPEVASVVTVKGGLDRAPALQLTSTSGARARVPLDQISVFPATLDGATRAYSGGRHGVDLSALDN